MSSVIAWFVPTNPPSRLYLFVFALHSTLSLTRRSNLAVLIGLMRSGPWTEFPTPLG